MEAPFFSARSGAAATAEVLLPSRRITPAEACERYMRTEKGPWTPELTPELIEPLNMMASREYRGVVFVGPARSGKTMTLVLGTVCYDVTSAPGDMLLIQMTQDVARDFSRMDLDRMIRNSPDIASKISPRARDDNTFDKFFRSGVVLKLGWPSVAQLSGKTIQYVVITDYDRPKNRDDVDGEGPLFDLAGKRTETYMSRGKVLAESSPAVELTGDLARWKPESPHDAPPVRGGIVSLYNRGTRAAHFWPCKHCNSYMHVAPGLRAFAMPPDDELEKMVLTADLVDLAGTLARMVCRVCGGVHETSDRRLLKSGGRWLHEGETFDESGRIVGTRRQTNIASYWLGGIGAAFQTWDALLLKYLQALQEYVKSGGEEALLFTVNTDQAAPYVPRAAAKRRNAELFMERRESWPEGHVPAGVRFLTAAVDVQGNRFVCETHGWGTGLERWLVERWEITASRRREGDRNAGLEPAAYLEDWLLIRDEVMAKRYPLADDPTKTLGVHFTVCDSGGKAGVTTNAYDFWRQMKREGRAPGIRLVRGDPTPNAPIIRETYPEQRADRRAGGRGDVPVWQLNTVVLKDAVVGDLARDEPGPGYSHFPLWVDRKYFDELTAETRTAKGYTKTDSARNEAFDLYVYGRAACLILGAQRIDWTKPPPWATDPLTREPPAAQPEQKREAENDIARLAAQLNNSDR